MSDFISLTEFCQRYGKDPGNTRRLLAQGRIPGAVKVGRQWILPADARPPEDQRVKSGAYRNWRRKKTEA